MHQSLLVSFAVFDVYEQEQSVASIVALTLHGPDKIRLSLNKNSYDEMAGHIEEIQRIGQTIQSRAEIGSQAELRDVHLDVQTLLIQQQSLREIIGKQGEARNDAEEIHRRQLEQFIIALVDEQRRNLGKEPNI
jgi:hypothetical protein